MHFAFSYHLHYLPEKQTPFISGVKLQQCQFLSWHEVSRSLVNNHSQTQHHCRPLLLPCYKLCLLTQATFVHIWNLCWLLNTLQFQDYLDSSQCLLNEETFFPLSMYFIHLYWTNMPSLTPESPPTNPKIHSLPFPHCRILGQTHYSWKGTKSPSLNQLKSTKQPLNWQCQPLEELC